MKKPYQIEAQRAVKQLDPSARLFKKSRGAEARWMD